MSKIDGKVSRGKRRTFTIALSTIMLYINYVFNTIGDQNRQALSNIRDLLVKIDPNETYDYKQRRERAACKFLSQLIDARLTGIEDNAVLVECATKDIETEDMFPIEDAYRDLNNNELSYIESNVKETLSQFYTLGFMDRAYNNWMKFNTITDINTRKKLLEEMKSDIDNVHYEIRRSVSAKNTEEFSLDEDVFEESIARVYERAKNPSIKLRTGMVGFNKSLAGGFESGRVYIYLGLPGEGKSTTLLNLALQIKQRNKDYITKDPTKKPCIVFLTMENTMSETIERVFNILVSDNSMSEFGSHEQVIDLLRNSGFTMDNSPIDLVVKYVPANTVTTDYLYTLYDELQAENKECICVFQDYIKKIHCRDYENLHGDLRLGLGAVIDEFKEFAAAKQIPVITASQLNREAIKGIDDGRKANKSNLVTTVGRGNIGESLLILENIDAAFIISPEFSIRGEKYLGVSAIKRRFKGATLDLFFQPYNQDRPIELLQDLGLVEPLYRTTMVDIKDGNNSWENMVPETQEPVNTAPIPNNSDIANTSKMSVLTQDIKKAQQLSRMSGGIQRKLTPQELSNKFHMMKQERHGKDNLFFDQMDKYSQDVLCYYYGLPQVNDCLIDHDELDNDYTIDSFPFEAVKQKRTVYNKPIRPVLIMDAPLRYALVH